MHSVGFNAILESPYGSAPSHMGTLLKSSQPIWVAAAQAFKKSTNKDVERCNAIESSSPSTKENHKPSQKLLAPLLETLLY